MSKRAVVLAGGKGLRLRPYTAVLPKPLMPLGNYPILEIVVRQLVRDGFDHITMAVNHQAEIIKSYFNNGKKWGTCIDYSVEKEPLGTMGPLRLLNDLPENFMLMNGDVLTDINFKTFFDFHSSNENLFTIATCSRTLHSEFGVLKINKEKNLSELKEKPVFNLDVSMGIYGVSKGVLKHIPKNILYGFDNLMHDLIATGKIVKTLKHDGYWLDIGRPDDYHKAIEMIDEVGEKFFLEGK